ncbi:MAG: nuclear transport factor 2 family protein [Proteobacteria bacterium]|nr:nuclear transport factor 2 family protein [Pseudomonadota bacterium]HQR03959.1 nuclear transport factor 2 family protein [Rhodocyclaceae bacterium]
MNEIEVHILSLSRNIVEIELRRDSEALAALICDDYVGVDPSGTLIDKSVSVGRYSNPDFQLTQHGLDDVHISSFDETAIEIGIMNLAGRLGSFSFGGRYRYTHFWLKTPEGWKVRASQLTPLNERAA